MNNSLNSYGQKERFVVTKQYKVISGHRRYMSMKNLGWEECEFIIIELENEVIYLLEFYRNRTKTNSDILNTVRYLKKELKKILT